MPLSILAGAAASRGVQGMMWEVLLNGREPHLKAPPCEHEAVEGGLGDLLYSWGTGCSPLPATIRPGWKGLRVAAWLLLSMNPERRTQSQHSE